MKYFPYDKYKYFVNGNKIIAISTYAGKTVRGVATCHPEDNFDMETGKQLAAMRCDLKVREKRWKAANRKAEEKWVAFRKAEDESDEADIFLDESYNDWEKAKNDYQAFMNSLKEKAEKKTYTAPAVNVTPRVDMKMAVSDTKPGFWSRIWNWFKEN